MSGVVGPKLKKQTSKQASKQTLPLCIIIIGIVSTSMYKKDQARYPTYGFLLEACLLADRVSWVSWVLTCVWLGLAFIHLCL